MSKASSLGRWRTYGLRGLLAITVTAGSAAMAIDAVGAATKSSANSPAATHNAPSVPSGRPPFGAMGRPLNITSVSATTLVGTAPNGTSYTYTLTASTTYTRDGAAATVSDLASGENVFVMPTSSSLRSSTSGTAKSVNIISPSLAGTVVSVSGSSGAQTIVVQDSEGFYRTVVASASTTYTSNGSSVSNPTISAGAFLGARGTIASDHTTLDATAITLGRPTPPRGPSGSGLGHAPMGFPRGPRGPGGPGPF